MKFTIYSQLCPAGRPEIFTLLDKCELVFSVQSPVNSFGTKLRLHGVSFANATVLLNFARRKEYCKKKTTCFAHFYAILKNH